MRHENLKNKRILQSCTIGCIENTKICLNFIKLMQVTLKKKKLVMEHELNIKKFIIKLLE